MTQARVVSGLWSEEAVEVIGRPEWHKVARCRGETALFFAHRPNSIRPSKAMRQRIANAKALCRVCPVANLCLDFALDNNEEHGIWGGLTPQERAMIRARRGA